MPEKNAKKNIIDVAKEQVSGFSVFYNRFFMKITIAGKAKSTIKNYERYLAHIALYFKKIPTNLTTEEIEQYLFFLKTNKISVSDTFFKLTICALKFVFKMEGRDDLAVRLPVIRRGKKLPVVLSKIEVINMINKTPTFKHRLLIALLYGCGLRCGEIGNIHIKDIDLHRNMLHVRQGKGNKDRYLPLGNYLINTLKLYFENYKPKGFLFKTNNRNQLEQKLDKSISKRSILSAVKASATKAGIIKNVNTHTLRHTYATHLLEDGLDILSIRDLMGHSEIETTMIYLNIVQPHLRLKFSPIDNLTGVKIIHGIQCSLNFETEE